MTWLTVPQEKLPELADINAQFEDRQCTAMPDANGVLLTGADKLQDEYWSAYHDFLSGLTPFEGDPVWPVSSEEEG